MPPQNPSASHRPSKCRLLQPPEKRLSKPPRVHSPRAPPATKKLQRHRKVPIASSVLSLYILQYESYPYGSKPGVLLGAFSDLYTAAAGAGASGATGLPQHAPTEELTFLTKSGRVKVLRTELHTERGIDTKIPKARKNQRGTACLPMRLHPDDMVYIALEEAPSGTTCIGAFTEKTKAWSSCVGRLTQSSPAFDMNENVTWMDEEGMPHLRRKIVGRGWHHWFVRIYRIDELVDSMLAA
ncbi:uncharacterized protein BDR25DRAFT_77142 [Lindgomyces ingoldianus]|uniref:Uncharacterized protein n=1 Tax=Lindgomyces ingoldianus TaxID=673940 RepID=A0ACB6QI65_9PLEO|nr:uncharacterized protein BDR25DRAFT_77142 [Lindgomyces ingoldianus]KAF2466283.1 hypothetical protein BDR25DRAFT_77142 [Lindgomyces ingoldianus]